MFDSRPSHSKRPPRHIERSPSSVRRDRTELLVEQELSDALKVSTVTRATHWSEAGVLEAPLLTSSTASLISLKTGSSGSPCCWPSGSPGVSSSASIIGLRFGTHAQTLFGRSVMCRCCTQAALIYIAARLVVPAPTSDEPIDLSGFFDSHRRKFMGAIATLAIVNEVTNLTLQGFNTSLLGMMVFAWVLLALTAFIWESKRVQYAVAALNVILTIWYAATFVRTL